MPSSSADLDVICALVLSRMYPGEVPLVVGKLVSCAADATGIPAEELRRRVSELALRILERGPDFDGLRRAAAEIDARSRSPRFECWTAAVNPETPGRAVAAAALITACAVHLVSPQEREQLIARLRGLAGR